MWSYFKGQLLGGAVIAEAPSVRRKRSFTSDVMMVALPARSVEEGEALVGAAARWDGSGDTWAAAGAKPRQTSGGREVKDQEVEDLLAGMF